MSNEFKIEKNIPIPNIRGRSKYPLEQMEVGDSFYVPPVDGKTFRELTGNLNSAIKNLIIRKGYETRKYITRKDGEGRRVWRVQ